MQNNKWIVFVNLTAYPCETGGLEIFNYYLINKLNKTYNTHQLTYCNDLDNSNVNIHKLKRLQFPKLTSPIQILLFLFRNKKDIRLVHVSFSRAFWTHWFVYVIAKKLFNIKYIMTIHGGSLAPWKPKWPYRSFFKNAELITGVSDRIIQEYTKRSNREIIYTPPLIPFEVINTKKKYIDKWKVKESDIILLYAGSLKPLKSVDTLIEALGVLSIEKIRQHHLKVIIAGDGISIKKLENRVNELNLTEVVSFLGIVDRKEMHELYNLADLYTICSEFEGLPISLLEAFANNLPCVTSDAPGLKEISENNKNTILFKTKDYIDYSNKIELLLESKQLQNRIKINSKSYYEKHFSYDVLMNEFKKLIEKVA